MSNYKEDLDKYAKAYNPESKYEFDNKLMLQWYPRRIAQKLIPGNILELGLGHGYRRTNNIINLLPTHRHVY